MVIHDPERLDAIQSLGSGRWQGEAYRHMFADLDPLRENTRGARWNPPETPAIYASLERATALAEAEHQISLQPLRPRARRTVYRLFVTLDSVIDLTAPEHLARVGLDAAALAGLDWSRCRAVGGAVAWLNHDGLLVPSVRAPEGCNLVIFPNNHPADSEFAEVLEHTVLPA